MIRHALATSLFAACLFVGGPAASTPLSAPSASNLLQHVQPLEIETVQNRDNRNWRGNQQMRRDQRGPAMRRPGPRPRYAPGARFRSPPPGYRRYGGRPGNWRTRGCVTVGAIWFCP